MSNKMNWLEIKRKKNEKKNKTNKRERKDESVFAMGMIAHLAEYNVSVTFLLLKY